MMNRLKKLGLVLAGILLPYVASADSAGVFPNPLKNTESIQALVAKLLEFVVKVGTIIAVFAIIWVGFLFISAQGNSEKISEARKALLWTIIGAVILIGAQVLSEVICNTAVDLGANASC